VRLCRWDVVKVPAFEGDTAGHPAVVLSPEDMLADEKQIRINVLIGTKKQPAESPRPYNVTLNGADGLGFATLVNCALVYMARKSQISERLGSVSHERRKEIQRKVRASLGLG